MSEWSQNRGGITGTWAVLVLGAVFLAGCGGADVTQEESLARSQKQEQRDSPTTAVVAESVYGIDEVMPVAVTRPVMQEPLPEPDPEPSSLEEKEFLLPDLGISPGDGGDHLREGEVLFVQKRFLEAASHLSVATREQPEGWYGHYLLGLALWKAGDLDSAETTLWRAAELHPGFTKTFVNLSRVLNDAGRYGEALAAADRGLDLEPANPAALYLRGRSLANLGRADEAHETLLASLQQDPGNGYVHNRLGLLLIRQGRFEEAATILETAVDLLPEVPYIRNNLGIAYENSGRIDMAATQYAAGLEIDAGSERLQTNLARVTEVVNTPVVVAATQEERPEGLPDQP